MPEKAFSVCIKDSVFIDPACGSGNFLTETYISLRRLENKAIKELQGDQIVMGDAVNPIKVNIHQFYGFEINDFAVTVAKTALWIAESQMMKETEDIVHMQLDFLPLETNATIIECNALRIDWWRYIDRHKLSYIMGNPPFVGQALKTKEQSDDTALIFGKGSAETKMDYVVCWYKKALDYMQSTNITAAFVSTNSICQGESVPTFWKRMISEGAEIQFAHTNFEWSSEASDKAAVFCVIVGFSAKTTSGKKTIITDGTAKEVEHINAYLIDADDIWLVNRSNVSLCGYPKIIKGNEPSDARGQLFFTAEERSDLISKYPFLEEYILPFIGGQEYLDNKQGEYSRYCLWCYQKDPSSLSKVRELKDRFIAVSNARSNSSASRIQQRAEVPYLFCQIRQPSKTYLVIPRHTTSSRKYIPFGFESPKVIVGDSCSIIPDVGLFEFGVLTSNVHMAWTRVVCGRLGMGIRYSPSTYNNFPWPLPTYEQKLKIEQTAKEILEARSLYPDRSLSALYDPLTMPVELRKAHQNNDKAVMAAFGIKPGDLEYSSESACVAMLMRKYKSMTENNETAK